MNQDQSLEEQPEFRSQHLSPVSPRPVSFPQPSNIPILENQMDPSLCESSIYSGDTGKSENTVPYDFTVNGQSEEGLTTTIEGARQQNTVVEDISPLPNGSRAQETVAHQDQSTEQPEMVHYGAPKSPDHAASPAQPSYISGPEHGSPENHNQASRTPSADETMSYSEKGADGPARQDEDQQISDRQEQDPTGEVDAAGMQTQSTQGNSVDIQALLDNIVNAAAQPPPTQVKSPDSAEQQSPTDAATSYHLKAPNFAVVTGLPPRPPTNDNTQALGGPDILSQQPSSNLGPPGTAYQSFAAAPPPGTAGAPGTGTASGNLPPPPLASFQNPKAASPREYRQRESFERPASEDNGDDDVERRWGPEVQRKYDSFLEDERMYVMKGEWEKFPANSRLFIGNLPTEKVTKRDLFHVFHKYGKLAQVSIKQAYGFVQFLIAQDCLRALEVEQGVSIRGRKIHLEISKPQRNKNQASGRETRNRRSRSPDNRAGNSNPKNVDRYRSGDNRQRGGRRSPSPRSRDLRRNSPDRSGRRRSRSPGRRFSRGASPPRDSDDDCPLPRRAPQDVPDVQVIVKGDPDRAFVSHVEKTFEARGVRTNVLLLSPRLPEPSVMRRQIIEGVLAVMKLDRSNQMTNQFQLSVFDRSQGANNVRFEGMSPQPKTSSEKTANNPLEYASLDLNICIELVLRAKQTSRPVTAQQSSYSTGPYGLPAGQPQPPPMLSTLQQQPQSQYYGQQLPNQPQSPQQYGPLDTSSIQNLLSRVQQPSAQHAAYGTSQPSLPQVSDLSRLLASAGGSQSQRPPPNYPNQVTGQRGQPQASAYPNPGPFSPTNSYNQPQQQQQPQQQYGQTQPVDMKNIMAGLARWKG